MEDRSIKDKLVMLVAIAAVLACIWYLFLGDFEWNTKDQSLKSLGILTQKRNTIRQRKEGSLAWKDLKQADKLYLNDQVFTQENSTGKITFNDGTTLEMAPKTLIKLDGKSGKTEVNLVSGFMLAKMSQDPSQKGKSKLSIKAGSQSIDLSSSNASFQIQAGDNGENQITLLDGQAFIEIDGVKYQLDKTKYLKINKSGKATILEQDIVLLKPTAQENLWFQVQSSLKFVWFTKKQVEDFKLIITSDLKQKNVIINQSQKENKYVVNQLPPGNYFWSVESKELKTDKKLKSLVFPFYLQEDLAPIAVNPKDGETVHLIRKNKQDSATLKLEWENQDAESYQYEILSQDVVLNKGKIKKNFLKISDNLKDGPYTWKIKASDTQRPNSPWSSYYRFRVKNIAPPSRPTKLSPRRNQRIPIGRNLFEPIKFSWSGDPKLSYKVEVALDEDFDQIIFEKSVEKTSTVWASRVFGKYYWRVTPNIPGAKKQSLSSATTPFKIIAMAPNLLDPSKDETVVLWEPGPVEFQWEEVFFSTLDNKRKQNFYVVEASPDDKFEEYFFQQKTYTPSFLWEEPEFGDVYWRAKARPFRSEGAWSKIYRFNIQKSKPPKPPKLLQSIRLQMKILNSFLKVLNKGRQPASISNVKKTYVDLTWPELPHVKSYVVEVYKDRFLNERLLRVKSKDTNYRWKNPPAGRSYMRVMAIDHWDQKGEFSPLSKVYIEIHPTMANAPKLSFPENEKEIEYDDETTPISFKWKRSKFAKSYDFILAKNKNFQNPEYKINLKNNQISLDPNENGLEGKYFWKVKARFAKGRAKSSLYREVLFRGENIEDDLEDFEEIEIEWDGIHDKTIRNYENSYLLANYSPTTTSMEQTDSRVQPNASGSSVERHIMTFDLEYYKPRKNGDFIQSFLFRSSGDAWLQGFTYSNTNLEAYYGKYFGKKGNYLYGGMAGLNYSTLSLYTVELGDTTATAETTSSANFSLRGFAEYYATSIWTHGVWGSLSVGGSTITKFGYQTRIKLGQNLKQFFNFGAFLSQSKFEEETLSITYNTLSFQGGIGLLF